MLKAAARSSNRGFTLIEMIIALAIAVIALASIYNFYVVQHKSYVTQDRVTEMQQNLRIAMEIMIKDIRMAGFDITLAKTAGAGVLNAGDTSLGFTLDRDMDGDCGDADEDITYSLITDENGIRSLGRRGTATEPIRPIIPNVEALGFAYAIDHDHDGQLDTDAGETICAVDRGGVWFDLDTNDDGVLNSNDVIPGGESTGIVVNLADIRAVYVWLLVSTNTGDSEYINLKSYVVGNQMIDPSNDTDPANDGKRMRLLTTIVKLRNMAL